MWAGPAIALFIQTVIFFIRHRHLDDEIYLLEQNISQVPLIQPDIENEKRRNRKIHERSMAWPRDVLFQLNTGLDKRGSQPITLQDYVLFCKEYIPMVGEALAI